MKSILATCTLCKYALNIMLNRLFIQICLEKKNKICITCIIQRLFHATSCMIRTYILSCDSIKRIQYSVDIIKV